MTDILPLQVIRTIVRAVPAVVPHLSEETRAMLKAAGSYDGIRTVMHGAVFGAVFGYLSGEGYVTTFREAMATAISRAYIDTADTAYEEGGGELPLDDETAAWARGMLDEQLAYIDALFEDLRDLRKAGGFDAGEVGQARAEGYASALDGFYNEAVLRGSKNKIAYWRLGKTEKHCNDCLQLNGQGHKISWYIEHDFIPRKSGCALECGGWECDCGLEDKDGNEITI